MEVLYESCCGIDVHKSSERFVFCSIKGISRRSISPLWLHYARPA